VEALSAGPVEWSVASRARPGQSTSGDTYLAAPIDGGLLLGALDGVGHGGEAARAAEAARRILEAHREEPIIPLLQRCHLALRGTRGVVASLASVHAGHGLLTWLGVGNVLGVLLRADASAGPQVEEALLLRSGVVGARLPPLQAAVLPLEPGDTLVFATDGIASDFERGLARHLSPEAAARAIGRHTDDALVLVARHRGGAR
jgi:serine phosphatase RsbU (regulator of sigma subunit)